MALKDAVALAPASEPSVVAIGARRLGLPSGLRGVDRIRGARFVVAESRLGLRARYLNCLVVRAVPRCSPEQQVLHPTFPRPHGAR